MKLFVWSWDQQEPSLSSLENGCAAILPNGRWASLNCDTELVSACLSNTDSNENGLNWVIDVTKKSKWSEAGSSCVEGASFSVPHNGFSNSKLVSSGFGQTMWLNTPLTF
jgi:hypothetical protein